MKIEIRQNLTIELYGLYTEVLDADYGKAGVKMMDAMWAIVRAKQLKNKGINHWVYDSPRRMFVGVELESRPKEFTGLEQKKIFLRKYAYYKHIGPYDQLKEVNQTMRKEMQDQGLLYDAPCVEVYGHQLEDGSQPETEVLFSVM